MTDSLRQDCEPRLRRRLALGESWHNNGRPVLPVESIKEQARDAAALACSFMGQDWFTAESPYVTYRLREHGVVCTRSTP